MSRDRADSDLPRRRAHRDSDSDADGTSSPRTRANKLDQQAERIARAERMEREREQQAQRDADEKEERRKARSTAKKREEANPDDSDDAEEAARQARRAARRAARQAAETASAEPVITREDAQRSELVRDVFGAREEEEMPRFRRARISDADLDTPATSAVKPRKQSLAATEEKPKKARREDAVVSSGTESKSKEERARSPEKKPARTAPAARAAVVEEQTEEPEEEEEEEEEKQDHVNVLNSPPSVGGGFHAGARSGSFSGPQGPGIGGWDAATADRQRITSIAAAQKSLDVAGLNKALKNVPAVFFQKENFNPFNHWNERPEQLADWMEYVDVAVEKIVDAYHKGFNTATSSFSHVLDKFSESQKLVKKLQENLAESKRLLQSRNQNLKEYYFQNRQTKKMKEIMEKIAYVLEVPYWMDIYMASKQYLHAAVLLRDTHKQLLSSEDLNEIEGLDDLREEILNRKNFVASFLVEELHRIIYMKPADANAHLRYQSKSQREAAQQRQMERVSESVLSFNPDGTRVVKTHQVALDLEQQELSKRSAGSASAGAPGGTSSSSSRPTPADSKYSPFYLAGTTFDAQEEEANGIRGEENASSAEPLSARIQSLLRDESASAYLKNPESSPRQFLNLLVSALDHMNQLPSVKTQVNRHVRSSLLEIIQRETQAAKERAKFSLPRRILARATESGYLTQGSDLLVELIERIFSVLTEVLSKHLEVIEMIQKRLGGGGSTGAAGGEVQTAGKTEADTKFTIEGVWQVCQIVMQTTLTDYLHANSSKVTDVATVQSRAKKGSKSKSSSSAAKDDLLSDLSFTFLDSSSPSVAKMSRGEKLVHAREYRAKANADGVAGGMSGAGGAAAADLALELERAAHWIQATPYNITAVYRPVVKFTDHANTLLQRRSNSSSSASASSSSPKGQGGEEGDLAEAEGNQLRSFLKIFIEVSFLPRVEADVNIRLDEVLNDPSAFDAREVQRDARYSYNSQALAMSNALAAGSTPSSGSGSSSFTSVSPPLRHFPGAEVEHNLLFKCIVDISDVLKKNFQDMYLLPHSEPEFLRIIEGVHLRVKEKCEDRFHFDLVKNTQADGFTIPPQQLLLRGDEKILNLMEDDPLLKILRLGDHAEAEAETIDLEEELQQYFSHINPIYSPLFQKHARFDRSQLQFDTRIWSQLSLMAESMEWLADRIFHMNVFSPELSPLFQDPSGPHEFDPSSSGGGLSILSAAGAGSRGLLGLGRNAQGGRRMPGGTTAARFGRTGGAGAGNSTLPLLSPFRLHLALERKRHGESPIQWSKFLASKSWLDQKRWMMAEQCLALADKCLFTLRLELHAHLVFFTKEMQSGAYWCTVDSTEPEQWVLEMNRDLTIIDDAISKYLSTKKKKYVFGGCSELLTNLLVRTLAHLQDKRVNSRGVAKICRNFFALQQNLNNIDGASSSASAAAMAGGTAASGLNNSAGGASSLGPSPEAHLHESHFDRARQYYELLNYSQEELHLFQLENPDMYSAEEYQAIADAMATFRP